MTVQNTSAPAGRPTRRPGRTRVRWQIAAMACAGVAVSNIDRSVISVALPHMSDDMHISPSVQGLVLGWFFLMYAVCLLPAGAVVGRFGARIAFGIGGLIWGAATLATAAVQGVGVLLGLRVALGVGESSQYPSCVAAVGKWFPRSERGTASAIWDTGARIGGVLTLPLVTTVIGFAGWRAAFLLAGGIGVLWAIGWLVTYRDPDAHPRVGAAELAHIKAGQQPDPAGADTLRWRELFRYRATWGLMAGFFCFNYIAYFFVTWFPSYLVDERGFDLLQLGLMGMIPGAVAICAELLSGVLQDRLTARGLSTTMVRKTPLVVGMLGASVIAAAVLVPSAAAALALLSVSYGLLMLGAASLGALPADIGPSTRHAAALGGIQNCAGNVAGFLGPVVTGWLLETSGSFTLPLLVTGVVSLAGAAAYLFLLPRVRPLDVDRS
ncbi:MFS transporter [Streptomyces sp. NPDC002795]|uniref:MFS transporter n=1 Tax=Streptomyces sp. NPDC002795 TaxID=3364665 RepID=UPI00369ECD5B